MRQGGEGARDEFRSIEGAHTRAVAAGPQGSVPVEKRIADEIHRESVAGAIGLDFSVGESRDSRRRADPDIAIPTGDHTGDRIGRQAVLLRKMRKSAVVEAINAGLVRRDPEGSLRILGQVANPDIGGRGGIDIFDRRKAHAIESNEAALGSQPQVTVARLDDGVDRGIRETLLGLPDPMHVLREPAVRIEAEGRGCAEHEQS